METSELVVDKVCRTCLSTSSESYVSFYNQDEFENVNLLQIFNQTFNQIVQLSEDLPHIICLECRNFIVKAFDFKLKVHKSTNILLGREEDDVGNYLVQDAGTQTEEIEISVQHSKRARASELVPKDVIQFDDENFENINLSEDSIFDQSINPLMDLNSTVAQAVTVKTEETGVTDEEYESGDNIDEDSEAAAAHVVIKSEQNEDLASDGAAFISGNDDEERKFKVHKCDQCSKCFSRSTHLKRHKLTHEEGKIQCSICEKRFTRIDHLNLHVASNHSETKPFQCDVPDCKKGFVRQEHLKKHIEAKHSDGHKTKETCDICQKTFTSKKYLRTHMKSHAGDNKGLCCKFCNTEFSEKSELNDHLSKEHQNEKPYLCSECGLRFVRNDYLVIHMRRHMGVKPYKCRFCEKGFPRATDLTVHERYHTNEKTHLCNLCGKGFQRAYNLLVHMRVHTGEKPYQCSFCNKSFSQGNDLKAHIRRHTGERFKCDLCSEGFIQGYHLTHHKRTVHGLDVKSHIRRVEKFVAPTNANQLDGEQIEEGDDVKMENEYQVIQYEIVPN